MSGQFIFVDDNAFIEMQDLGYLCAVLDFRDSSYDDELHVSRFWHNNERNLKLYSCGNQPFAATVLLATDQMRITVPPDVYFSLYRVLKIDISYALNWPVSEVRIEFFRALIKKGDPSWILLTAPKPISPNISASTLPARGQYLRYTQPPSDSNPECQSTLNDDGSLVFYQGWVFSTVIATLVLRELIEVSTTGYKTTTGHEILKKDALKAVETIL